MKWYDKIWYNITHNAKTKSADIYLYGIIGNWDISAAKFIAELNALEDIKTINVHINSPGGEVADGIAIYNTLKNHDAEVITYVDAEAASIASVVMMAGKRRVMYNTSNIMIHEPWMIAIGNSKQLRKDADILDKYGESIIKSYLPATEAAKLTRDDLKTMMEDETWMDADEAMSFGFATEKGKDDETPKEEETSDVYKSELFSKFRNIPARVASRIKNMTVKTQVPLNQTQIPKMEGQMKIDAQGNLIDESGKIIMAAAEVQKMFAAHAVKNPGATEDEKKAVLIAIETAKADALKEGRETERKRQAAIRASGETLRVKDEIIDKAIADGVTESEANGLFIDQVKKNLVTLPGSSPDVTVTKDERVKFVNAAIVSMSDASGLPAANDEEKKERIAVRRNAIPRSIHALIRVCAEKNGVRNTAAMGPEDLCREAVRLASPQNISQGTGDFTNILADTINKAMGIGLAEAPTTYQLWAGRRPVKDFRTYTHAKISGFSDLDVMPEGAAFKQGAFSDAKETGAVTTKGKAYTLSRQAIINDDMSFVSVIPRAIMNSVGRKMNRDCYDLLTSASLLGPTMTEDSLRLFHATHANYVAHAAGAAPSTTTLAAGTLAMSKQALKAPDQASGTQYANITPKFIIAPRALKGTIDQIVRTPFMVAATYPAGAYNPYGPGGDQQLNPVYDAYLDSINSPGWYLAGDPNQVDTLIVLTLQGNETPTLRSEPSRVAEALGISWDLFFDWGVMIGDWRGLYFNDGN